MSFILTVDSNIASTRLQLGQLHQTLLVSLVSSLTNQSLFVRHMSPFSRFVRSVVHVCIKFIQLVIVCSSRHHIIDYFILFVFFIYSMYFSSRFLSSSKFRLLSSLFRFVYFEFRFLLNVSHNSVFL